MPNKLTETYRCIAVCNLWRDVVDFVINGRTLSVHCIVVYIFPDK